MSNKIKDILYIGAEWCPPCRRARSFLDERNIAYQYKSVDDGQDVIDEMLALSKGKYLIPTLKINDKVIQNPSNTELKELLEEQGDGNENS